MKERYRHGVKRLNDLIAWDTTGIHHEAHEARDGREGLLVLILFEVVAIFAHIVMNRVVTMTE